MRKVLVEARTVKTQPVRYSRESSGSERKCMICMDNPINTILLPCGHQVSEWVGGVSTLNSCFESELLAS